MALSDHSPSRCGRGRALSVIASLVLGAGLFGASAGIAVAVPATTVPGAIVAVDIAAVTSGPFEKVRIDLRFAIPDAAAAGDQFHLALPPQLLAAGPGFVVTDSAGEPIAIASTVGNVVTFTTTPYVDQHDNVIGSAFLEAGWDRRKLTAGATVDLAFDADGTVFHDAVTLNNGIPDRSRPDAWLGWADERAEDSAGPANALRWTAATPRTAIDGASGSVALVMASGPGSSISCDRLAVSETSQLDAFNEFVERTTVPAERRTVTCAPGQVSVTVTGVAPGSWVVVAGRATVTDSALDAYTATATITANGSTTTTYGLAAHSPAGGNGGGTARSAAAAASTSASNSAAPRWAGATATAPGGAVVAPQTAPNDATGASEPDTATRAAGIDAMIADTPVADAGARGGAGGAGSLRSEQASSSSTDARTNGFQWRAVAFLAAVGLAGAGLYLRRRR